MDDSDDSNDSNDNSCPNSPLDSNDWEGVCPEEDVIDDLKKDKNHTHTNSKGKFNVANVKGPGIRNGLTVIVDTLQCGWLSSSVFDGIKVKNT